MVQDVCKKCGFVVFQDISRFLVCLATTVFNTLRESYSLLPGGLMVLIVMVLQNQPASRPCKVVGSPKKKVAPPSKAAEPKLNTRPPEAAVRHHRPAGPTPPGGGTHAQPPPSPAPAGRSLWAKVAYQVRGCGGTAPGTPPAGVPLQNNLAAFAIAQPSLYTVCGRGWAGLPRNRGPMAVGLCGAKIPLADQLILCLHVGPPKSVELFATGDFGNDWHRRHCRPGASVGAVPRMAWVWGASSAAMSNPGLRKIYCRRKRCPGRTLSESADMHSVNSRYKDRRLWWGLVEAM